MKRALALLALLSLGGPSCELLTEPISDPQLESCIDAADAEADRAERNSRKLATSDADYEALIDIILEEHEQALTACYDQYG